MLKELAPHQLRQASFASASLIRSVTKNVASSQPSGFLLLFTLSRMALVAVVSGSGI